MLEALTLAEINRQHAELLPARTVLSLFSTQGAGEGEGAGLDGIGLDPLTNLGVLVEQLPSANGQG